MTARAKPKTPELPWLPPSTPSTWVCAKGHINPLTQPHCRVCR
jgi:hypothetical protein